MVPAGIDTGEYVLLGRVTRPHGVRGEVKIYPYSGQPENFLPYREIYLAPQDGGSPSAAEVERSRVQGSLVVVKLAGCSTREQAEQLAGREILLRREDLPEPGESEYYWLELENKKVVTEEGEVLGRVAAIFATGAHDIISVTGTGREYLIPVHRDFMVRIDEDAIVLRLPPGLLEMNR
jgi:16S rRNA processing protein RimM